MNTVKYESDDETEVNFMLNTNAGEKFIKEALTFDDVLLVPRESDCTPDMVDLHTNLTKDIVLNTPILTSAMDTVTGRRGRQGKEIGKRRYRKPLLAYG